MNKKEKKPGIDSSKGFKNKKNKKEKKENKKASTFLTLDITLISRVKDLGLSPPMNTESVTPFIGELEGKLKFFHEEALKNAEEAEAQAAQPETVNAETTNAEEQN